MNRFAIENSFGIQPDRFVFAGRVLEGQAKPGMIFEVPEAGHRWRVAIQSIEIIRKSDGTELTGLLVEDAGYLPGLGTGWTAELHENQT